MDYPEYIDRLEIVAEIDKRTRPNHEGRRAWRDKINKQIKFRIGLGLIATNTEKQVCFLDVSEYVKQKFPDKFNDWPSKPGKGDIQGQGFATSASFAGCWLPGTNDESHKIIEELTIKLAGELDTNRALQAENERLKPSEERRLEIKKTNTINGSKKKVPRTL
jgi:hypothetical protein